MNFDNLFNIEIFRFIREIDLKQLNDAITSIKIQLEKVEFQTTSCKSEIKQKTQLTCVLPYYTVTLTIPNCCRTLGFLVVYAYIE